MNKGLLVESQIAKAEQLAGELNKFPGLIRSSLETFRYVANDSNVSKWTEETEVGRESKRKILANCDAFEELANQITGIYQSTQKLIAASKRSNQG